MGLVIAALRIVAMVGPVGVLVGCASTQESMVRRDLARVHRGGYAVSSRAEAVNPAWSDSSSPRPADLAGYTRIALERSPDIVASFERWQASVLRISKARRLPEPTIGLGYFVRSIETRVGPQLGRISLQQSFPWPTRLTAGVDAASTQARAMQRLFEAKALAVAQGVATAYWDLWQIRTTRVIHLEHLEVLRSLSQSVRAQLVTGAATLADLQQVDLRTARVDDRIRGMDHAERSAEAKLRATIGVTKSFAVPTPTEPGIARMPSESPEVLLSAAQAHPMIDSLGLLAEASQATARSRSAERFPQFTLGADWIITGEASVSGVEGSGRDAVLVGAGVKLPLWQGSYGESIEAAQADARAHRAEQRSSVYRAEARLAATLAALSDATRRVALYRGTLIPQAKIAHESVLGSYSVGRATVAQALLSQRDLLELRIELEEMRAHHARTWATLEQLVGRELTSRVGERDPSTGHKNEDNER